MKKIILPLFLILILLLSSCSDKAWGIERDKSVVELDGETFTIEYKITNGHRYLIEYKVYVNSKKNPILSEYMRVKKKSKKNELVKLYEKEEFRIYRCYDYLLYYFDNTYHSYPFHPISPDDYNQIASNEKKEEVLLLANALAETNNWNCWMYYAELLISRKDNDVIERLKLYAQNSFTQEELSDNADCDITQNEFVDWANSMVQKYNL